MTAPLDLDALKKLCNCASPAPWEARGAGLVMPIEIGADPNTVLTSANVAFMAAARTALPALIAEVERLRAVVAAVAASVDDRIATNAAVTLVRGALRDAALAGEEVGGG